MRSLVSTAPARGADRRGRGGHEPVPTAGHLVSWAKYGPRPGSPSARANLGPPAGQPWLASALGEAGISASRTKTFLDRAPPPGQPPRQTACLVAVGNSLLVIAWHLLSDPDACFADLGPGWHDRLAPLRRKRQLIAELERLSGKKVLLQKEAAA
jgi:transposase